VIPHWTQVAYSDRVAHAYMPDPDLPGSVALCGRGTGEDIGRGDPNERPDVVDTYGLCQRCVAVAERRGLLHDSRPGLWRKAWSMAPAWVVWRLEHRTLAARLRRRLTAHHHRR